MTLHEIYPLLNCEGPLLRLLRSEYGTLYIQGVSMEGEATIIAPTSPWNISLYLRSRITLKEVFLLSQDFHFFILSEGKTKALFFEISTISEPKEIFELSFGDFLYGLLPREVRTELNPSEILELLPGQVTESKSLDCENLPFIDSHVQFFQDGPVSIVSVKSERLNPDEHDYIQCDTIDSRKILAKINPYSLFLLLSNRISIKEIFMCSQDYYIIKDSDSVFVSKYSRAIESLLKNLCYSDLTYFSLPKKYQIENPIEYWKYYVNNVTISGKGILEPGFESIYPIEVQILK